MENLSAKVFVAGHRGLVGSALMCALQARRSIMNLSPQHIAMVETARSLGASAKYTGSGGAIIGTYWKWQPLLTS